MVGYFFAKLKSRLFRNHDCIIRYFRNAGIQIGTNCHIYSNIKTTESYLITIGSNTTISNGVQLITHDNSLEKLNIGYSDSFGKITIGSNCFIGARCLLLYGCEIGDNTIVAAGSVVTKSFPPGSVVGGAPAKLITTIDLYRAKVLKKCNISIEGLNANEKKDLILKNIDKLSVR